MNITITGYQETTGKLLVPEGTTVDELRQDLAKILGYKRDASGTARFFILQAWEAELVKAIGRNTSVTSQELALLGALRAANTGDRSRADRAQFHAIPDLIEQRYIEPGRVSALHRAGRSLQLKGLARRNTIDGLVQYAITDFGLAAWGQGVADAGLPVVETVATQPPSPIAGLVTAFDAERERIEADAETRVTADEARTERRMARLPERIATVEAANAASRAAATAYDPETMSREITAWAGSDPHRRAFLADVLGAVSFDGPADGERGDWNDQAD